MPVRAAGLLLAAVLIAPLAARAQDVLSSDGKMPNGAIVRGYYEKHEAEKAARRDAAQSATPPASAAMPPAAPSSAPSAPPASEPAASDPAPSDPPPSDPSKSTPPPAASNEPVGFGSAATGGKGRRVVEVTNLRDSPEGVTPWPGSLRAALAGGDREIHFRVSGSIKLEYPLVIRGANVTVDGSDAPDRGIAIYGAPMIVNADNVVLRYVRFRGGYRAAAVDGLEIGGGRDILVDHVSCSWASDECISIYGYGYTGRGWVRNVTIQNSLIAEMPTENPYGLLIDGDVSGVTLYRNVFAKNANRNPQITTGRGDGGDGGPALAGVGRFELIQNIIYDAAYGTRLWNESPQWTILLDVIGNLWKAGPRYPRPKIPVMIFTEPQSLGPIKVFLADNVGPDHSNATAGRPCDYFSREAPNAPCAGYYPNYAAAARQVSSYAIPGRPASEDFEAILANAGAIRPCPDDVDARVIDEVKSGTGRQVQGPGRLPALNGTCP